MGVPSEGCARSLSRAVLWSFRRRVASTMLGVVVSNGNARCSSSIVYQPVVCSESPYAAAVDARHMPALQVGEHGGVIDRLERLPGAVTALHLRELADTGHELVRAGWGIPCLARFLADEAHGVEVRTTTEELPEQQHLVGRRAGGEPQQRHGRQRPRSWFVRCELASKRGDSGFRRDTLRFDPREVRLCLREPGYAWVRRNGRAGHSRPDLRQALSNEGNVLPGASAKNLPKLARRNDLERASCREAQQRSIASDEQVGVAGERLTEHNCVRRIDIHASGLGVVDDLRCLAGDEIDNLGRPNDGKLDLCTQRLLKFAKHVSPKDRVVVQQHQFEDLRTQSS